jgi:4-hydroxyacetophenone monooxygenase
MKEAAGETPRGDYERQMAEAVAMANVPTLLLVLHQLTGDPRWLEPPFCPERSRGLDDNHTGGLPEDVQAEVRAAALGAILADKAGTLPSVPPPEEADLARMLAVSMGEPVPEEYAPMIAAELGAISDPTSPQPLDIPAGFKVAIIGAGISGMAAAVKLGELGIPYTVLERHDHIGGTWLENSYPGCGVDTPSALYSFSFAPNDWSKYFALRDEIRDYLEVVGQRYGIEENVRFHTEVVSARYDADRQLWRLQIRDPDGDHEIEAAVLISAVGAFTRPKMPVIPGLDSFDGPVVHTARWPDGLDLEGKRVAVIGTGASSMQLVPAIAGTASEVLVFQRSPQWVAPFGQHLADVPDPVRFLNREVALYRFWYRIRSGWTFNDKVHPTLQKEPGWPHPERAVSAANDGHRKFFLRHLESELAERPELIPAVTPTYPPFGKRILLDNGWYRALARDDVTLVTERIEEIVPEGIRSGDGDLHEVDVVVCATGFDVVRFLAPIEIIGRSGTSLRETWDDDDARAYLGLAVPDFPNFFILFGPNTQTGHGGSLIGSAEIQLDYILDLLRKMVEGGIGSVECRPDVYEVYNERVDAAHEQMVWTHPGMETYYRNSRGRVVVNNPFRVVDYWHMTREVDLGDYLLEPRRAARRDGEDAV